MSHSKQHTMIAWMEDKPGVLAKITGLLADFDISIEAIHQDEPENEGDPVMLVLLTSDACANEAKRRRSQPARR